MGSPENGLESLKEGIMIHPQGSPYFEGEVGTPVEELHSCLLFPIGTGNSFWKTVNWGKNTIWTLWEGVTRYWLWIRQPLVKIMAYLCQFWLTVGPAGPWAHYSSWIFNCKKQILQLTESTQHFTDSWDNTHEGYMKVSRTSLHSQDSKKFPSFVGGWVGGIEFNTAINENLSRVGDSYQVLLNSPIWSLQKSMT